MYTHLLFKMWVFHVNFFSVVLLFSSQFFFVCSCCILVRIHIILACTLCSTSKINVQYYDDGKKEVVIRRMNKYDLNHAILSLQSQNFSYVWERKDTQSEKMKAKKASSKNLFNKLYFIIISLLLAFLLLWFHSCIHSVLGMECLKGTKNCISCKQIVSSYYINEWMSRFEFLMIVIFMLLTPFFTFCCLFLLQLDFRTR